jgi:galactofuranosylgalactofuranosylrhamnosyl-N-acetylglucosaminyl-diphospho-decaprenol beta-1,5/1,6-galactofuranosyltransferase
MCLIPRSVAEDVGMPLPLFIKWDDAEYGLRARSRGYRTATVPGIAIWHMSFLEKDDTSDWQAYFHYRNRYVAAALHGPDNPRALLVDTFKRTLRHLLLMEYSAVALQEMALRDFLAGPEALFPSLPVVLGEIRAKRAEYDDGRPLDSATQVPLSDLDALAAQAFPEPPTKKVAIAKGLARSVLHNLRSPNPAHHEVPQRNVPSRQALWFVLSRLDSATVSTPDGRGVTFRRRDPELFRSMLARSARQLRDIGKAWPDLRRRYRDALPELSSREAWAREVFDRSCSGRGGYCAVPSSAVCHCANGRSRRQRVPSRVSTRSSQGSVLDSASNSATDHPSARRASSRIARPCVTISSASASGGARRSSVRNAAIRSSTSAPDSPLGSR